MKRHFSARLATAFLGIAGLATAAAAVAPRDGATGPGGAPGCVVRNTTCGGTGACSASLMPGCKAVASNGFRCDEKPQPACPAGCSVYLFCT
jgi:hypothetical protein